MSPQNPLKPQSSPYKKRLKSARKQARGRAMVVTDLEKRLHSRFTYETLRALKRLYPGVEFSLVMGADNLANFRQWRNWREVAEAVQVVIVSRPGVGPRQRLSAPKHWIFLNAREHAQSSTALRSVAMAKPRRK